MFQQPRNRMCSVARPAGASDESDSDDDLYYCGGPSRSTNTNNARNSNPPLVPESWEDDDTDNQQSVPLDANHGVQEFWGTTVPEVVRLACIRGTLEKLQEQLCAEPGYNINKFFEDTEENPLITACQYGNSEIVKYLLKEKSANPNEKHYAAKSTALMAVATSYDCKDDEKMLACVTELISAGADLNIVNRYGMTALMLAVKQTKSAVVTILLENGADANLIDPDGRTALFFAVMEGEGRLCRRLLEHGADVNIEDRFGLTVPELAQDQNFPELANLLFSVRNTKWLPGLHPKLMDEVDEVAAAERKARRDDSLREDSCIELMLQAVDGEKYLNNFRKHKISYVHFLTLDDDQLKEIGVEAIGVRERLLDNIKRIHNGQWQSSSIRNIATNKNVTAAEAVCMVVNIKEHFDYISSTLSNVNKRIRQKPLALQYDVERNKVEDLMKFCEQAELSSRQVRQDILEIHKTIGELQGYTELQINGRIQKRLLQTPSRKNVSDKGKTVFQWKLGEKIVTSVGLVSVCLFIGLKYWKRSS